MTWHLSGFLQLPDGGSAGPPGGLLAPHVLHLAHHHHLHPLRLPCQGRGRYYRYTYLDLYHYLLSTVCRLRVPGSWRPESLTTSAASWSSTTQLRSVDNIYWISTEYLLISTTLSRLSSASGCSRRVGHSTFPGSTTGTANLSTTPRQ